MINIYALVNPIDNKVFYVGATKQPLKTRLMQHVSSINQEFGDIVTERRDLISMIREIGKIPIIELLDCVNINEATECEKMYYEYFTSTGCKLYQDSTRFKYKQSVSRNHKDEIINYLEKELAAPKKSILANEELANKVLEYGKNNGMGTFNACIRICLIHFFKSIGK